MSGAVSERPVRRIDRLIEILATLRTPVTGCDWDLKQTHATLAPYALEEAYEVVDAIERGDVGDLRDELGDYLLQVVFHARLAEEAGHFDFADVVEAVSTKMVRRHPHIFSSPDAAGPRMDEPVLRSAATSTGACDPSSTGQPVASATQDGSRPAGWAASRAGGKAGWEAIKAEERARSRSADDPIGSLAGVPAALPALTRAVKLQARASAVGFDWSDAHLVLAKIREEVDEVEQELTAAGQGEPSPDDALRDEIGDLLFAVANLARHVGVDPETAARAANGKFERRFAFIERELATQGSSARRASLAEMEMLWNEAKRAEAERRRGE